MKRPSRLDVLLIVVFYLGELFGVAVGDPERSSNFAGLVDIDSGRKFYLQCNGRGSPTVVFVGGFRASADDWSISGKSEPTVFDEVVRR